MTAATTMRRLCLAWLALLAPLAPLSFAGCGPDRTDFGWAPDGQHAFARGPNGYFIVDSSGRDLGLVSKGGASIDADPVKSPQDEIGAWMPDSTHVILERFEAPGSWHEYAQLLGPKRTGNVVRKADELTTILANYRGDRSRFLNSDTAQTWYAWYGGLVTGNLILSQVIYYLDNVRPRVLAPFGHVAEASKTSCTSGSGGSSRMTLDLPPPCVFELRERDVMHRDRTDRLLIRSSEEMWWAVPSPDGRAVAVASDTTQELSDSESRLDILSVERSARPVLVASNAAATAAWSPGGQDLVFEQAVASPAVNILNESWAPGLLQVRRVCTQTGDVIAAPEPAKSLALINVVETGSLAWLPDGRILFTSIPVPELPTFGDAPDRALIFALRTGPPQTIERLIPEQLTSQIPDDTYGAFVVSPDGKKVAIGDSVGALSVFFLDTGTVVKVQEGMQSTRGMGTTAPSWKSADELSYVVGPGDPDGSPDRAELVIWNVNGNKQAISKSWADVDWLPRPTK